MSLELNEVPGSALDHLTMVDTTWRILAPCGKMFEITYKQESKTFSGNEWSVEDLSSAGETLRRRVYNTSSYRIFNYEEALLRFCMDEGIRFWIKRSRS